MFMFCASRCRAVGALFVLCHFLHPLIELQAPLEATKVCWLYRKCTLILCELAGSELLQLLRMILRVLFFRLPHRRLKVSCRLESS